MPAFINKDNSEFRPMREKATAPSRQIINQEQGEDMTDIVEILQRDRGRDREERELFEEILLIIRSRRRLREIIRLLEAILERERRRRRRREILDLIEDILDRLRRRDRDRDRDRDRWDWDRSSENMIEREKMIEHPNEQMPELIERPQNEMPEIIKQPEKRPEQMPTMPIMPIMPMPMPMPTMPIRDEKPHCPGQMPVGSAKDEMMNKIMSVQFMVLDIALYLDTHPCDTAMINKHNFYADMLRGLIADYERTFNEPLTIYGISPADRWAWVSEKWPWNKCDMMRKEC